MAQSNEDLLREGECSWPGCVEPSGHPPQPDDTVTLPHAVVQQAIDALRRRCCTVEIDRVGNTIHEQDCAYAALRDALKEARK